MRSYEIVINSNNWILNFSKQTYQAKGWHDVFVKSETISIVILFFIILVILIFQVKYKTNEMLRYSLLAIKLLKS